MFYTKYFLTALAFLVLVFPTAGQKSTLFQHFDQDTDQFPTIIIDTDLKHLIKQKRKEEYQQANFQFELEGKQVNLPIKIRARGHIRKKVCYYPPLKLDFHKHHLDSLGLVKGQDVLKLVIPCKDAPDYIERLKMEHFIYDLYSVIEPYHLNSTLVEVEFRSEGKMLKHYTGFLVEHEDHYARRLHAKMVNKGQIRTSAFQRSSFLKLCFFQYMIANTDWSVNNRHNLEIIKVPESARVLPIAYDFDYAGIINQPYAVPAESLPIEYVTDRHFYTFAIKKGEAIAMANYFKNNKSNLLAKCDDAHYLTEKTRKHIKDFIEEFYKKIDSEKSVIRITNAQ